MEGSGTTLVFGPQTLSFQDHWFQYLRSHIRSHADSQWMIDAIRQLPRHLDIISRTTLREHGSSSASKLAEGLSDWLFSDASSPLAEQLPNAIMTPLVVLNQLAQYSQFVEVAHAGTNHGDALFRPLRMLGFCTGFLSTLAVACSRTKSDFQMYGNVAVRLGALIGAVVDAAEATYSGSVSITSAWTNAEQAEDLERTLAQFSETYISVHYDDMRATVTTSAAQALDLLQALRSKGFLATDIGLRGRYHWNGHRQIFDELVKFCNDNINFQFPEAKTLMVPISSTTTGEPIAGGQLHEIALRDILLEPCRWYPAFQRFDQESSQCSSCIVLGDEKCVPPSIMRKINKSVVFMSEGKEARSKLAALANLDDTRAPDDIAVVGMACRVAGADDPQELWDLMCRGESQHIEVPESRFTFETQWREYDPKRKWFGNFLREPDSFDHKFFKKSPREASSQDPQQRLFLQSAYQAVEQSGYFNHPNPGRDIGVFVGVCAADYEANIACYQPNAFTATGNLKSFITGKVSHYFGWTGPAVSVDTACSASAVAIHQACKAIINGECSAALAGGVTIMTSPLWFQNLAGATFLSTTGACKPFDAQADGYCRGEAIASVFLKKMSQAVQDGDTILGRVRSTAVLQNDNCTPIFVPNSPSLTTLFENVVDQAHLRREDITLVEAHGTGTPVGDPAEYESVRQVLGGRSRRSVPLHLGSIKGLIGHTEAASGVMALIKVILLIYHGFVPPQASFKSLSPGVKAMSDDMIKIDTHLTPWKPPYRAALINNYGASGSNASIVVSQTYANRRTAPPVINAGELFWIPGHNERSLREYCIRLRDFIKPRASPSEVELSLANISQSLSRQTNRRLPLGLIFQSNSIQELDVKLSEFIDGQTDGVITTKSTQRPVILCFGGQISQTVGLEKGVYDRYGLLRRHLDRCDSILVSMGCHSIYPTLFDRTPIEDTVKLQTTLFAFQYSCAKSWIDSGAPVTAVVGHSFGELTAMCVAGVMSLEAALGIIAARGRLVRDLWGPDPGAMIAVEAELAEVQELLRKMSAAHPLEQPITIACYNGPRSYTLAGSTSAVKALEAIARAMPAMRSKLLSVTNAYHSNLVGPLEEHLTKLTDGVLFTRATVHWERATEEHQDTKISSDWFAAHMRQPVYANHAFQRLHKKLPDAIWLEAGSNSTITHLAGRALGLPKTSHFQAANICTPNGLQNILDLFANLWREGLAMHHWGHHASQARQFDVVILPPYQFERSRHWLELKEPQTIAEPSKAEKHSAVETLPTDLFTFTGYKDEAKTHARFRVNTMIRKYEDLVSGHVIAHTAPICPATVQLEIAIESLLYLRPDLEAANLQPEVHDVTNLVPVCINPNRAVWMDLHKVDADGRAWDWEMTSDGHGSSHSIVHVKGRILLRPANDPKLIGEFSRYERMMSHKRSSDLLHCNQPDDVLQGRNMYKVFAEIVDYKAPYHGLQKLVGKANESAGRIAKEQSGESWLDAHLSDCFSQVGGFWVNCMTDRSPDDMFIAAGFESWVRAPRPPDSRSEGTKPALWDVMAIHHKASDKAYTTDIFVYDSQKGTLCEVILGINYIRIPKATMIKTLTRLTVTNTSPETAIAPSEAARNVPPMNTVKSASPTASTQDSSAAAVAAALSHDIQVPTSAVAPATPPRKQDGQESLTIVTEILAELTGLELDAMKASTKLADIGIDSLMGMEMTHELESMLKISLDVDQLAEATCIEDVVRVVAAALGLEEIEEYDNKDDSDAASVEKAKSSIHTPNESSASSDTSLSDCSPVGLQDLDLPMTVIIDAFAESKNRTDDLIEEFGCKGYLDAINPKQTQLCIALILEAFEQLGCNLRTAKSGDVLTRIPFAPQHGRLVDYLYEVLESDARLVSVEGPVIMRTAITAPNKTSKEILDSLLANHPNHNTASRLAYYCGMHLVEVLKGQADGVKVIFGTEEGRNLVSGLYGDTMLNKLFYTQMQDILKRLFARLPRTSGPLKILEMGAGTGGTTKYLAPFLAELGITVEYTFTDLAPSFVAAARKKYKAYPFMRFASHDIEKPPASDLSGSQHLVIASNAVHATHSLPVSLRNIHQFLRPDGFLMMLEMTDKLRWVDMIFGLLEGWWLFDDGRSHALSHETHWERELHAAGYGHVDWTDGRNPENHIQRIIMATASGSQQRRVSPPKFTATIQQPECTASRKNAVDEYVQMFTQDFAAPQEPARLSAGMHSTVLVTGATGSLGSHLVAHLSALPQVEKVICLNRANRGTEAATRQQQAFEDRGLCMGEERLGKLLVLQCDTSKPFLGLVEGTYKTLVNSVTHLVHNAWPMSGNRPLRRFEPQLQTMRNLVDFSRESGAATGRVITFQFISSIAVVGYHPMLTGGPVVPEERVHIDSVLPNGYGDAKYACERVLDATLSMHPDHFRTMSVRLGQVAGNSKTGYWNTQEHLSFLVKSSQTLRCLPDFSGQLSWTPVDMVAGTLSDLLLQTASPPYAVYNIDNPVRQPWEGMIRVWASALQVPSDQIVPYQDWVTRVRRFPGSAEKDNPAYKLIDFLDDNFLRMSCGGLLLATDKAREHSPTLASVGALGERSALGFINYWKRIGFLSQ